MKVLIVEDKQEKREVLQKYMEQEFQAHVDYVVNERQAKNKLIDAESYDVVLLDMTLPDMVHNGDLDSFGGINVLSSMEDKDIIIPVIIITSYWDFKKMLKREMKEPYWARNLLFQTEIDYETVEMVENFDLLDGRHKYMSYTFSRVYFASVEFSFYNDGWKVILKSLMEELTNEYISV